MPTGLIVLITIAVLVFAGCALAFAASRAGRPSVRFGAVKRAERGRIRAERTLADIEDVAYNMQGLDLVGDELRRRVLEEIRKYRAQELKEKSDT